ncbi:MAG: CgeB family protein [Planctomycetota bacterium]|jgi:glycosyltransferase involved in cell wall biosynthesis
MKVLISARMDGWMGVYWSQVANGFRACGHECRMHDYRDADPAGFARKFMADPAARIRERRTSSLIAAARAWRPDIVLTHSFKYDFPALRDALDSTLVVWDIDGPAGGFAGSMSAGELGIDLLLTVSKPVVRRQAQLGATVRYLPHGADLEVCAPGSAGPEQVRRFASALAFIGKPCDRRNAHLETLAGQDLVVWGARWSQKPWRTAVPEACRRERANVVGEELVEIYRAATVVLNISREDFVDPPTTLNLHVFHAPAAGACLLTEWVEEIEEAFEPGTELLVYRGVDDFKAKALEYSSDGEAARRIGRAGRRRCEQEHSLRHRAASIVGFVDEIKS